MNASRYGTMYSRKSTKQTEPIPGREKDMKANRAGGYIFTIDPMKALRRFLILGTESNTYYASAKEMTIENARSIEALAAERGEAVVAEIVKVSQEALAPKNDPALFALALCAASPNVKTRQAAFAALPLVARIPTHLFIFNTYLDQFVGWGRGRRTAVGNWFLSSPVEKLAFHSIKYKQRDGWTMRDLLRLAHPKAQTEQQNMLFKAIVKGEVPESTEKMFLQMKAAQDILKASAKDAAKLITKYDLPHEVVPSELRNSPEIWEALLEKMPLGALLRNLSTLTRVGIIKPLAKKAIAPITARLCDEEAIVKARLHPFQVLLALMTYGQGHGMQGSSTWTPVLQIKDALEETYMKAFKNVVPSGKSTLIAVDASGSMNSGAVAGCDALYPFLAALCLALVTAKTEPNYHVIGFHDELVDIPITARTTLAQIQKMRSGGGWTNASIPFAVAEEEKWDVESFIVLTDSETWAGPKHPVQALQSYRRKSGIDAKLVCVGMTATDYSICDQHDPLQMDVTGFDSSAPGVIADFVADRL